MTELSAGLPSQKQVIELLDGEFARAGYEIEDVLIDTAARPPRITVIADGDNPLDLDSIAQLSRSASDVLERRQFGVRPRGHVAWCRPTVDHRTALPACARPLGRTHPVRRRATERAARRRRYGTVQLVVRERARKLPIRDLAIEGIVKAVVQVESSPPNQRELGLAGLSGKEAAA